MNTKSKNRLALLLAGLFVLGAIGLVHYQFLTGRVYRLEKKMAICNYVKSGISFEEVKYNYGTPNMIITKEEFAQRRKFISGIESVMGPLPEPSDRIAYYIKDVTFMVYINKDGIVEKIYLAPCLF